jgi:hypothetical protein
LQDNYEAFCQAINFLSQEDMLSVMKAVQDKNCLMNMVRLFTLGDLTLPHGVLKKRTKLCGKLVDILSPEMSCEILKRNDLSYALI